MNSLKAKPIKKILSVLLAAIIVLGIIPGYNFAEAQETGKYGVVEGLTANAVVEGANSATPVVKYSDATLIWAKADPKAYRYNDGWWIGIKVTAPSNMTEEELSNVKYQTAEADTWSKEKDFMTYKDSTSAPHFITLWGQVNPQYINTALSEGKKITYKWQFDWDKDGVYEQLITLNIDPKNIILNKDGETVYPATVGKNVGKVELLTGTGDINGSNLVDVSLNSDCNLNWSEKNTTIGRNEDGWWVGLKVSAPAKMTKLTDFVTDSSSVTYQRMDGSSWSGSKSFWDAQDSDKNKEECERYIGLWGFISEGYLENALKNGKNIIYRWRFDWDKDGVFEQLVNLEIDPTKVVLLDADGNRVKLEQEKLSWMKAVPNEIVWTEEYKNTVTGGSTGKDAVYSSSDETVATVNSDGNVTLHHPGKATITATLPGDERYNDITVSYTLNVIKAQQAEIYFDENPINDIFYGESITNAAHGGSIENAEIIYTSSNPTVVTVDNKGKITAKQAGPAIITATINGNEYYEDISSSYTVNVLRAEQKKEFRFENSLSEFTINYGDAFKNEATGGENSPISYSSSDKKIATVDSNGVVTVYESGQVTITATNPADERYEKKQISYTLNVERADQKVKFADDSKDSFVITYGEEFENKATANTDITYMSSDDSVATVNDDGSLNIFRAGTVTITATAKQTAQYNLAEAKYTLIINPIVQTVNFDLGKTPTVTFNDNDTNNIFVNTAKSNATEAGEKNITPKYSIIKGGELIKEGSFNSDNGSFEIKGAGEIIIGAAFDSNERYTMATDAYTLTVEKSSQTIAFPQNEYKLTTGEDFKAPKADIFSENHGEGAVRYTVESDKNGVIKSLNTVTGEAVLTYNAGTVVVRATIEEDSNYLSAYTEYTLTVSEWIPSELCYDITGKTANDSGWFAGNISIKAKDGYEISTVKTNGDADWRAELTDAVTEDGAENKVSFYIRDKANGYISCQYTETVKKDEITPTAEIKAAGISAWEKFLTVITLGMWEPDNKLVIEYGDNTSGVSKVEYYIDKGITEVKSKEELDNISEWTVYKDTDGIPIEKDSVCVVYAKVTDNAGNYIYASTNGIIFDRTAPTVDFNAVGKYNNEVYYGDVQVDVTVADASPYSGISKVEYWITNDENGVHRTTGENNIVLFRFDASVYGENGPEYKDLISEWNTKDNGKTITVDANKNSSDYVCVHVLVTDNAGNEKEYTQKLRVISVEPVIEVKFLDDPSVKKSYDGVDYYDTERKAEITITHRTSVFKDFLPTVTVDAVNAKGSEVSDSYSITEWTTVEPTAEEIASEAKTSDDAAHKAVITFNGNAEYDKFEVKYTNKTETSQDGFDIGYTLPKPFVVDKDLPTASVTIKNNTWSKIFKTLTFGLWSKEEYNVTAVSEDATSPTVIDYYISNSAVQLTEDELKNLSDDDWKSYKEEDGTEHQFTVSEEQYFAVYLRVKDYAGNTIYLNSDGHVIDKTASVITLTSDKSDIQHNGVPVYNKDVNVKIDVTDAEPYSGIKTVEYWVICDGKETQEKTNLYSFTEQAPKKEDLKHSFSKTVTVKAADNNSCNVKVYAGVTDNAGNYTEKEITLDIDITPPTINVTYDNDKANKIADNRGYFPANRTATVVITERTGHFNGENATKWINVDAVNAKGSEVSDSYSISEWKTVEPTAEEIASGAKTADDATHTATVAYNTDANYTFAIGYTDLANNSNDGVNTGDSVAPYEFTVDKLAPTGSVTVNAKTWKKTWTDIVKTLTFGLWSRDTVNVSGTHNDATSPIESVMYYKTSDTVLKTKTDLSKITEWRSFDGFDVPANEQFVVYVRIVDFAGNVRYISTNGVIVDNAKPVIENVKPEITITPEQPKNGFYNNDVKIDVKVIDPKSGETGAYSGLKEIRYEVLNLGDKTQGGVLYSFKESAPTQSQLKQLWEKKAAFTVDKTLNNSNDVVVRVYAVDNAGNENDAAISLKIDITAPVINISYDNNKTDSNSFFKANRTATVVITERNFNPDDVQFIISNTDGSVPTPTEWKKIAGTGNLDNTTWTSKITYSADGDYKFAVQYEQDLAGNKCSGEKYADGTAAAKAFTIDKTVPIIKVSYDNNSALNKNYYKESRTAKIEITEHNFNASRVNIMLTATDDGASVSRPAVSDWVSEGDKHTAVISYVKDGRYSFDISMKDKAGNESAEFSEQVFYVDKTAPTLEITGVKSANNGAVIPIVSYSDTNYDDSAVVITLKGYNRKEVKLDGEYKEQHNGKIFTFKNFAKDKSIDDIYTLTAKLTDKAGNMSEKTVLFSVNRFGSTYMLSESTEKLNGSYVKTPQDVVITEMNLNKLDNIKVTLFKNNETIILKENTDYRIDVAGSDEQGYKYVYNVFAKNFADDGVYRLTVYSEDTAGNIAENTLDTKNIEIGFGVDATLPVINVKNLNSKTTYAVTNKQVEMTIKDNLKLAKVIVMLDGYEYKTWSGEELEKAIDNGGIFTFNISGESTSAHNLIVYAVDAAGNGEKISESDIPKNAVRKSEFHVTTNLWIRFYTDKPLFYGSIAGVVIASALIIFIIVYKKKKKEEK